MDPEPDNGETTYIGSGKLQGRKALITGGDSGIGRAVAVAFAREGADVAIGYLPSEEADAQDLIAVMAKEGIKIVSLPGDIAEEAFCKQIVTDAVAPAWWTGHPGEQRRNHVLAQDADRD